MEKSESFLKKNEIVLKEGENSNHLYWIMEGHFKVTTKVNNIDVEVNRLGPGDLIGELAFIDQKPRSATVTALTDAQVIRLEYEEFQEMLEGSPKWLKKILLTLSSKLRKLSSLETP